MRHGTVAAYTTGACRCEQCRTAQRRYLKRWHLDRLQGAPSRKVDAAPVHAHLRALMDAGMTPNAICHAAGWKSRNSIVSITRQTSVLRATADKVLAITPVDTRPHGYIDATGTRRRLQALAVNGWPHRLLAAQLGADAKGTLTVQNGTTRTVRRATAHAVAALYDELWDQPGPSRRSRTCALRNGWLPPLAWDDDTIDDPQATPDTGTATAASHGRPRQHVIEDYLDTWDHHGGDLRLAADRIGMTWAALTQAVMRAKREGADITWHNVYRSKQAKEAA